MGMMGCRGGPRDSVFWEERWEILGLTEHGNIVDARLIVTNRELLRGQGRVHLNYWSPSFMPVIHTREVDPREVIMDPQEDGLQLGTDSLNVDNRWNLRIASVEANLMLELSPMLPSPEPVTWSVGRGQWSMEALTTSGKGLGWLEAGGRGGHFGLQSVILQRGGDASPALPREGVFVLDGTTAIGFDTQDGQQLVWAFIEGEAIPTDSVQLERSATGARLDFRPSADLWIEIQSREPTGTTHPLEHLSWLESVASNLWTDVAWRRVEAGKATIHWQSEERYAGALLLSEGPQFEPVGNEAPVE